ncbi:gluconate kinase, SKI family [Poseidonocella pacifica]|uniref:Gluconokinase n=1 Tax=Poseidonocella pacifica TaxID=871651 RepID=A0A1I0X5J2_9RHOB|nr:gluconokinase [Poseidonocella pacifica]SFA96332.1 gluconate kinase, SKI family [Poseidonocella pacifica]
MRHILVMGVCGVGKSTVAQAIARELNARFVEADSYHPPENISRMSRGEPLTDELRAGWLDAVAGAVANSEDVAVMACSALKQSYRDRLAATLGDIIIIHLDGDRDLLVERMSQREDHFMPTSLIDSQFADLERPEGPFVVRLDVMESPDAVISKAIDFINGAKSAPQSDLLKGRTS